MDHAELEDRGLGEHLAHVLVDDAGGDDADLGGADLHPVDRHAADAPGGELDDAFLDQGVTDPGIAGEHHQLGRILDQLRLGQDLSPARRAVTIDLLWEMRVVVRSMTGVSNCSEISKARRVKSLHSWESEGSSIGTLANLA